MKLTGGGDVTPPPTSGNVTIDFNDKTIGQTEAMKAWYTTDGTATIAADPTNAGNKAVNIVTTNWDAFLKLNITLPSGKTLANYESLMFDIYIGTNANDANPNYKNMFIYLDDVKKYYLLCKNIIIVMFRIYSRIKERPWKRFGKDLVFLIW